MANLDDLSDNESAYCGLYRRGSRGRWRLCCRGPSAQAVLGRLLTEAPRGSDKLVREGSADLNEESTSERPRRRF